MPERLYACTPNRLATWLDCPRRYRMTYLDRPPPPKGPPLAHNSLGASVHNALAAWWRLPYSRRSPAVAGSLVAHGWLDDGFRDAAQSLAWRDRAREMVVRYVEGLDPADEPLGVERTVAMRTRSIAFSGRVDRLDSAPRRDGAPDGRTEHGPDGDTDGGPDRTELVVVDYKTGRRAPRAYDAGASMALALYALAAARMLRRPCRRVELHHLPTGEVAAWRHDETGLLRHLRRAEEIAAECAVADAAFADGLPADRYDEIFPPRPTAACRWCQFARHCPEGRAVVPTAQPWDGLPDLDA